MGNICFPEEQINDANNMNGGRNDNNTSSISGSWFDEDMRPPMEIGRPKPITLEEALGRPPKIDHASVDKENKEFDDEKIKRMPMEDVKEKRVPPEEQGFEFKCEEIGRPPPISLEEALGLAPPEDRNENSKCNDQISDNNDEADKQDQTRVDMILELGERSKDETTLSQDENLQAKNEFEQVHEKMKPVDVELDVDDQTEVENHPINNERSVSEQIEFFDAEQKCEETKKENDLPFWDISKEDEAEVNEQHLSFLETSDESTDDELEGKERVAKRTSFADIVRKDLEMVDEETSTDEEASTEEDLEGKDRVVNRLSFTDVVKKENLDYNPDEIPKASQMSRNTVEQDVK